MPKTSTTNIWYVHPLQAFYTYVHCKYLLYAFAASIWNVRLLIQVFGSYFVYKCTCGKRHQH